MLETMVMVPKAWSHGLEKKLEKRKQGEGEKKVLGDWKNDNK